MENFDAPFDDNYEIDPEIWLRALLAICGDRVEKARMVDGIVKKTGLPHEKVELIITCTINIMAEKARSN